MNLATLGLHKTGLSTVRTGHLRRLPCGDITGPGRLNHLAQTLPRLMSGQFNLIVVRRAGTLLNALGFPMLCLLGVGEMNQAAWSLVGLTGLWMASAQLVHEAAHQAQDRASGLRTSATVLGPVVSARVSLALLLMAAPVARGISPAAAVGMALYAVAVGLLAIPRAGLQPVHLRLARDALWGAHAYAGETDSGASVRRAARTFRDPRLGLRRAELHIVADCLAYLRLGVLIH